MHQAIFLWISHSRCSNLTFKIPFQWMMDSNWLQEELKGLLGRPRREGVAWQFSKKSNRNRQSRKGDKRRKRQNQKQQKHRSERSSGYSANHEHMKKRWKEGYETLEEPKSHTFGETQAVCWFCLNIWKLEVTGGFFPRKLVNLLLVRGTTSFYKPESENFTCWRKCYVEWVNAFKWAMLNVNYFVFSCVSLAVRVF